MDICLEQFIYLCPGTKLIYGKKMQNCKKNCWMDCSTALFEQFAHNTFFLLFRVHVLMQITVLAFFFNAHLLVRGSVRGRCHIFYV